MLRGLRSVNRQATKINGKFCRPIDGVLLWAQQLELITLTSICVSRENLVRKSRESRERLN